MSLSTTIRCVQSHHAPSVTIVAPIFAISSPPLSHKPPRLLHTSSQSTRRRSQRWPVQQQQQQRRGIYWSHRPSEDAHDITNPSELKTKEILHNSKSEVQPKPLTRPLGLEYPPEPGQNRGRDERTLSERYDDFFDADVARRNRRRVVWEAFHNNHYKDLFNIGHTHWGKSIVAPSTPYRAHLALYFPNLQGTTIEKPAVFCDTTARLRNRISIVGIMGSDLAREQIASFNSPAANPALHEAMQAYNGEKGGEVIQRAFINNEENVLRAAVVRMYFYRLRRMFPAKEWGRHWLNKRGLSMELRDCLDMWNHKVGYVYLLDGDCKIRWAGNGPAYEEERQSLVRCVKRLCEERDRRGGAVRAVKAGEQPKSAPRGVKAPPVVNVREKGREEKLRRRRETPVS
ncbi:MAG: Mitochondrial ATPase complex subunit atp10 [Chrysothrix sp. TS-e1954]|nr:MAG: Mitochondrial ATPase complex subunit atp10 [Chrysothrix sp. TS-e1954]